MNKKNGVLIGINILLILLLIAGVIFYNIKREKTAFIDLNKTYNDFDFKKELEKKAEEIQQKRKLIIDSLEFNLKILSKDINDEKGRDKMKIRDFEIKREDYIRKKQLFDEDNETMLKKYDEQIYKQLNQYVKDYGDLHHYTFIHGASGTGNIMYAKPEFDITNEVTLYINQKYKGTVK